MPKTKDMQSLTGKTALMRKRKLTPNSKLQDDKDARRPRF